MLKEVILTPEGYKKLQEEIDHLRGEKRREVAERIRVAREFGDIAENAEYDDAKNEQAMLEHKIAQLEERLLSARVISKKEISKDSVSVGSKVRLYHLDLYRLETERELLTLGLDEMAEQPDALVLVEWGEKFPSIVGRADGEIAIEHAGGDERLFLVRVKG